MTQLTATEEYEAVVEGVKQGILQYLEDHCQAADDIIARAVEQALYDWLGNNRYSVLKAMREA